MEPTYHRQFEMSEIDLSLSPMRSRLATLVDLGFDRQIVHLALIRMGEYYESEDEASSEDTSILEALTDTSSDDRVHLSAAKRKTEDPENFAHEPKRKSKETSHWSPTPRDGKEEKRLHKPRGPSVSSAKPSQPCRAAGKGPRRHVAKSSEVPKDAVEPRDHPTKTRRLKDEEDEDLESEASPLSGEGKAKRRRKKVAGKEDALDPCDEMFELFWRYLTERQKIWHRRNEGQAEPWTDDAILCEYSFCNIYRELDKGCTFLQEQYEQRRKLNGGVLEPSLALFLSVVYRLINNLHTFARCPANGIPAPEQIEDFFEWLKGEMKAKRQVFTGAHQNNGLRRYIQTIKTLRDTLPEYSKAVFATTSLEDCTKELRKLFGMGSFFAWQVCCDLLESGLLKLDKEDEWVQIGPGAVSGLKLIFPSAPSSQKQLLPFVKALHQMQETAFKQFSLDFPKWKASSINLKNMEHSLCEFSKYARLVKGTGGGHRLRKRQKPTKEEKEEKDKEDEAEDLSDE